ncbi:MAG: hypothetical protein QOK22_1466, partial [Gaiellaceae bacterium]|nr:hypothetical protein [Gaiellaceae bacterium]
MKRMSSIALAVVVIAAAGFAAASIASGASLVSVLTGTTATTAPTTTTSTTPGGDEGGKGRRVTVCHVTGSKKHPAVTITVSEHGAASAIKHGGHLGACTGSETAK